ncbi:MAG: glycosyltransferase family 4 protein [Flavobacteriales bacterium]|jgi:L-malate glycosyltransferase|nr:glycosyltransferase family 4 protein [Flavobacteriaceae bacterium]MBT7896286.1 glycosyltransferase family 4 protein [Flavobacteriales bacterium]
MKKLVCVHLLNDFSGSPKVLSQVINAVIESNYEVDLYVGNASEGFLSKTDANTFTYSYKRSNNKFFTLLSLLSSQVHLAYKIVKYRNMDIIIYVNTLLPFGAAIMGKLLGKPVIYHIHETYIRPKIFKQFLRLIVSKTASKIIFVSNILKELEQFKYKKQEVVYNALSKSFLKHAAKNSYTPLDKKSTFNVYMIASLKAYKGINELVAIAQKCASNKALQFVLILNAKQYNINTYFNSIELPENLRILATQQDLHQHYKNAGLVLNLSRVDQCIETFGLTIIEAMAYGIPVIVPPVGGPAEIVTNGIEGYLISSYKTSSIAEKIKTLSLDKAEWSRLSKNALMRSKDFNEQVFNKKLIQVLNA